MDEKEQAGRGRGGGVGQAWRVNRIVSYRTASAKQAALPFVCHLHIPHVSTRKGAQVEEKWCKDAKFAKTNPSGFEFNISAWTWQPGKGPPGLAKVTPSSVFAAGDLYY